MSGRRDGLPKFIDPLRLCEQGIELAGKQELAQMARLAPLLVAPDGVVKVKLVFVRDEAGSHHLTGQLEAKIKLICQRCLEPFDYPVSSIFKLAFVTTERAAQEVGEDFEPYLVTAEPVSLLELVEDELLLCVPHVPRHENDVCPVETTAQQAAAISEEQDDERQHPFAGLAELMKRNKE